MKPSPCLHPVRIYNDTLGCYINVPCGHCDACVAGKGFHRSERLAENMARFAHKYFFTLTFSDDYLPVAKYDSITESFVHPCDCNYDGVCYSVPALLVEQSLVNDSFKDTFKKYGGVPVLSRRICILFKKRLRQEFKKYYGKEYLFLYIVGEYGPEHYRPHYHGVLCTNADIQSSVLEMCVRTAWSPSHKGTSKFDSVGYGKIDFQRIISNGVRNYVAQYINCTSDLPLCLQRGDFSQFYQSSRLIVADELRYNASDLKELYFRCSPICESKSLINNSSGTSLLPFGIVNRIFPKCPKFGALSLCDRFQLYSIYERQPFVNVDDFVVNILSCFVDSNFNDPFYLVRYHLVDDDVYASKLRLKKLFYLSRRVCNNARSFGVSLYDYVVQIDLFWSRYELYKLKCFYELQDLLLNDRLHPVKPIQLLSLYYDTPDTTDILYYVSLFGVDLPVSLSRGVEVLHGEPRLHARHRCDNLSRYFDCNNLSLQSDYAHIMKKIVLDTKKTKRRNAFFEKHGIRRRSFISYLKLKKTCQTFFVI